MEDLVVECVKSHFRIYSASQFFLGLSGKRTNKEIWKDALVKAKELEQEALFLQKLIQKRLDE